MKFEFKSLIASAKTIKEKIEEKFDSIQDEIFGGLKKVYGEASLNERMFDDGVVFDKKGSELGRDYTSQMNSDLYQKLAKEYVDGWADWYKEVQEQHKRYAQAEVGQGRSGSLKHIERKREKRDGDPPHRPGQYQGKASTAVSYSIWSGMFEDEIRRAFKDGGSAYMDVANYMIESNWKVNKENWPLDYFKPGGIHEHMVEGPLKGLGINREEVVPFPKHRSTNIQSLMQQAIKAGFTDPTSKILNDMEIDI